MPRYVTGIPLSCEGCLEVPRETTRSIVFVLILYIVISIQVIKLF